MPTLSERILIDAIRITPTPNFGQRVLLDASIYRVPAYVRPPEARISMMTTPYYISVIPLLTLFVPVSILHSSMRYLRIFD
ncbi:hypothetical protein D1872_311750 [compost metagenome]